jgi:hypothetical protein
VLDYGDEGKKQVKCQRLKSHRVEVRSTPGLAQYGNHRRPGDDGSPPFAERRGQRSSGQPSTKDQGHTPREYCYGEG